jgi:hypothetical protein
MWSSGCAHAALALRSSGSAPVVTAGSGIAVNPAETWRGLLNGEPQISVTSNRNAVAWRIDAAKTDTARVRPTGV